MKKILLISLCLWAITVRAQFLQSVHFYPAYPGPMDSVYAIIQLEFTSGPCTMLSHDLSMSNDSVRIEVFHCPGLQGVICSTIDTINLGVLPVGNYHTNVVVRRGIYISADPCSGSSRDSSIHQFSVYSTSNTNEIMDAKSAVYYKPDSKKIALAGEKNGVADFHLLNVLGSVVIKERISALKPVDASGLVRGVYFYSLRNDKGEVFSGKLIID